MAHEDIDSAAAASCDDDELKDETSDDGKCEIVNDILKSVRSSKKPGVLAEKMKIDMEDLLMDILHHCKRPDFDPTFSIKIQVRDEPAVDTRGVLRQAFTEVLALFFMELQISAFHWS